MPKCRILIAKPNISVSTKYVYDNLDANNLKYHPDIEKVIEGLQEGDLYKTAASMENVLESVTIKRYPIIEKIKEMMVHYGAINALMSGSGPTVFGIFDDESKARVAYDRMRRGKLAKQVYLTSVFND